MSARRFRRWLAPVIVLAASGWVAPAPARAGGAWVPGAGAGDVQLGYSWKTARASWDPSGKTRVSDSWHIFSYLYLGGEVGVADRLSFTYVVTYLDGLEGERGNPDNPMEHNAGLSEAFFGLKVPLRNRRTPMALAFRLRTSYLYDLPGAYDRHLFAEGDESQEGDAAEAVYNGVSPEWRGLLGEDYGLYYLVSRSLFGGGWGNFEIGYNYRTGNLADEVPVYADLAYPLPWHELLLKGTLSYVQSVGNVGERQPNDRFGCSPRNCFPDASRVVGGIGFFRKLGRNDGWWVEVGFNQFLWGRSTRKYQEPYFTLGRSFGGHGSSGRLPVAIGGAQ